jgi:hypothetical protein
MSALVASDTRRPLRASREMSACSRTGPLQVPAMNGARNVRPVVTTSYATIRS